MGWKIAVVAVAVLLVLSASSLLCARLVIHHSSRGRTYTDISSIPRRRVGLVLGCQKTVGGWPNPFFENRISAAASLYNAGKVDFLVVSGDNHAKTYDEPSDMKDALISKGVPADRIYPDYAGFRTLDSVVRVKEIFGQDAVTIVSQHFHNQRAIFLAAHHGIDAIGFDAPDVATPFALTTVSREQLAKVKALLDVYILRKQPHFLGQRVVIGVPVT